MVSSMNRSEAGSCVAQVTQHVLVHRIDRWQSMQSRVDTAVQALRQLLQSSAVTASAVVVGAALLFLF
jgi:hypothetical protein